MKRLTDEQVESDCKKALQTIKEQFGCDPSYYGEKIAKAFETLERYVNGEDK